MQNLHKTFHFWNHFIKTNGMVSSFKTPSLSLMVFMRNFQISSQLLRTPLWRLFWLELSFLLEKNIHQFWIFWIFRYCFFGGIFSSFKRTQGLSKKLCHHCSFSPSNGHLVSSVGNSDAWGGIGRIGSHLSNIYIRNKKTDRISSFQIMKLISIENFDWNLPNI